MRHGMWVVPVQILLRLAHMFLNSYIKVLLVTENKMLP